MKTSKRAKVCTEEFDLSDVKLVDNNATQATASLFAYMKNIGKENILFGHQNTNSQGLTLENTDGTHSDVKNAVGAYPAVFGWDTLALVGSEGEYDELVKWSKVAASEEAIISISVHPPNFKKVKKVNGEYDFNSVADTTGDKDGDIVSSILKEGSGANKAFLAYLDLFAKYTKEIKTKDGEPYPMIFRPWHENSGDWFWWGVSTCTKEEYVRLFRYTVEYLRDVKEIHNLLYAYSPNGNFVDQDDYLSRYPGDEYIDIIGFDYYHDNPKPGDDGIDKLIKDAEIVSEIAGEKGKLAAISETGVRHENPDSPHFYGLHPNNNKYKTWFTDLANKIKENDKLSSISMFLVWRNGSRDHFFVPYKNHPEFGDHEMLEDFTEFYQDDFVVFGDRLQNIYDLDVSIKER